VKNVVTFFQHATWYSSDILTHISLLFPFFFDLPITQKDYFMLSSCSGSLASFQVAISSDISLKEVVKRTTGQHLFC